MNKVKEKGKKISYENFEFSHERNKTIKAINDEKKNKKMEFLSYSSLLVYIFKEALG